MKYRIPGRLGDLPDGWGGKSQSGQRSESKSLYESMRDASQSGQRSESKSLYESMLNVSQREADSGLYESGGLEPQPDEGKDEESSPLVWVAGLGAVGVLAYLMLRK
ncbi:MAG: hypothetical protein WC565_04190 [Parcubacteria group bacterium]